MHKSLSVLFASILLFSAAPVVAQTAAETLMTNAKAKADQEIDRRVAALTSLNTKVQAMTRVSGSTKSSLATTLTTEITNLTALNAKIQADTTLAVLRTDIASIATDYRTFKLIIPQGYVLVSADRVLTTAASYTTFGTALQERISQAQSAGNDATALNANLATHNANLAAYSAKVASATAKANEAIALVANLVPDGGDESVAASNKVALQNASAAIKVAISELTAARQLVVGIVQALQTIGKNPILTAKITINDLTNYTARVGETINFAWTSTGATSATSDWTQDSSSCGFTGTGPFDIPLGSAVFGGVVSELVTDCWAGHTYVNNYTVKDSAGKTVTASATVTVPPPAVPLTATLTVNGTNDVTVNVGDVVSEAWSSTGAKSADGTWTQDSSSCGLEGTGPFPFFGAPDFESGANFGGTFQETIADCYAGHTYVYTYTATDAQGKKATASVTIRVKALDTGGPSVSLEVDKAVQGSDARSAAPLTGTQAVIAPGANTIAAVGDSLSYSWNATGATSVKLVFTQDSSSCGYTGTGPFDYEINPALIVGAYTEKVTDCWKGHIYVVSLIATDAQGRTASDSVTVRVASTAPASCSFNGATIASGQSTTAYQSSTVPYGSLCSSIAQTRTCTDGVLSGSYAYASCTVAGNPNAAILSTPLGGQSGKYFFHPNQMGSIMWNPANGNIEGSFSNLALWPDLQRHLLASGGGIGMYAPEILSTSDATLVGFRQKGMQIEIETPGMTQCANGTDIANAELNGTGPFCSSTQFAGFNLCETGGWFVTKDGTPFTPDEIVLDERMNMFYYNTHNCPLSTFNGPADSLTGLVGDYVEYTQVMRQKWPTNTPRVSIWLPVLWYTESNSMLNQLLSSMCASGMCPATVYLDLDWLAFGDIEKGNIESIKQVAARYGVGVGIGIAGTDPDKTINHGWIIQGSPDWVGFSLVDPGLGSVSKNQLWQQTEMNILEYLVSLGLVDSNTRLHIQSWFKVPEETGAAVNEDIQYSMANTANKLFNEILILRGIASASPVPSSEYFANALAAIESALKAIGSWLGR